MSMGDLRLGVVFFRTESGAEPVRRWLKSLPASHKKAIGEDSKTVRFGWPLGMPLVEKLEPFLWEVRRHVADGIARVLFRGGWADDDPSPRLHQEVAANPTIGDQHGTGQAQAISGGWIMKKNQHIGSNFDDFLQEEGLLAEAEASAVKRVIAYQIEKEMAERQISKSALARVMRTSRSSLDRLLDPENASVTLLTLESVVLALGKRLKVQLA